MTIVAVIPAFNEEVHIHDVIKKARHYVDEVIVVDDCSKDATGFIAQSLGAKLVRHETNLGRIEALKSGFKAAKELDPRIIVTLYANGHHNPEDIPRLVEPILWLEADVVSGNTLFKDRDVLSIIGMDEDFEGSLVCEASLDAGLVGQCMGFTAFSSNIVDSLQFCENGTSVELSLLKDAKKAGYDVRMLPASTLYNHDYDVLQKYHIGVVVPAYNEEKLIKITVNGIPEYVDRIYVINDCSTDKTAEVLESIDDPRLHVITHKVNQGVGAAILHGYQQSLKENMDIVCVMGGDNQMNPQQLPNLLMPIIEGKADYTKGNRLLSEEFRVGMSKWRSFGNGLLTMITKIASGYWHIMDPQNGYTAISKKALSNMDLHNLYTYYGYCNDMLVKLNAFGFRTMDITMPARYGQERSTIKYSNYMGKVSIMLFKKFLWRLKMKYMVLSFHPLVLFYIFGMILVPLGVLFGAYILLGKMVFGFPISQNYPLLDALFLITGIQFTLFAMLFDMQECNRVACQQN
ncbi:glycosyl transferase [Methanolobus tindarius DSM 2278]|uniref:Glycosyl transferase n=1 Tax=Methanolobus tindarius DSM 2278 TaxID=1090322 RepID=W9DSZ9_METTI|nr:glycosyltransferase family 2 protein [Methanolobus tindarius]ETA66812.1 glycosyl transferase [Methanolobus tindarius DSM 2278]